MKNRFLIGALTMLLIACVQNTEQNLEEARFLLDQGKFSQAVSLLEPILVDEPSNTEAKFLLASAYVGEAALSPNHNCQSTDTGYLGTLACLLDDKSADDDSGLKTFNRISPDNNDLDDELQRAIDLLVSVKKFNDKTPEKDVALQRLIARVFAVSAVFKTVEANSPNTQCNGGGPGVDDVPDDYDSSVLTSAQASNFRKNLEGIKADATIVGFADDFNLVTRINDILASLDAIGGSTLNSVKTAFDNAYNSAPQQVCN